MSSRSTKFTTAIGKLISHPAAFLIVVLYGVLWFGYARQTFGWAAVATLLVFCMTIFIKRADRRDNLAIQAKLDELIKTNKGARAELMQIDKKELEEIEMIRNHERTNVGAIQSERTMKGSPAVVQ